MRLYNVRDIVSGLDGLFLTGSPSNIQPHHFSGPAHEQGTLEDPQRDSLTLALIKECVAQVSANIGGMPRLSGAKCCVGRNVACKRSSHRWIPGPSRG